LPFNNDVLSLTKVCVETTTPDLDRLLKEAQQGDAESFGELCRAHEGRLLRQAMALSGDVTLAEDLVQETLVQAWKSIGRFNGQCQLFTWFCAILLHRFRNVYRRQRPLIFSILPRHDQQDVERWLGSAADQQSAPDQAAQDLERMAQLHASVRRLPHRHREVIYLRFFVDDSLEGIAAALNCSVGTVKSRLFHALEKLRKMVRRHSDSPIHL